MRIASCLIICGLLLGCGKGKTIGVAVIYIGEIKTGIGDIVFLEDVGITVEDERVLDLLKVPLDPLLGFRSYVELEQATIQQVAATIREENDMGGADELQVMIIHNSGKHEVLKLTLLQGMSLVEKFSKHLSEETLAPLEVHILPTLREWAYHPPEKK